VNRDDRQRFERTVASLSGELRRAARRLAGPTRADDLVQETLLRAFVAWHRVVPGTSPRGFMHTILRNTFLNERRRNLRECALASEPPDRDRTLDRILDLDLRRALSKLPDSQRGTLLAVDGEGLGYREAAVRARTPLGTVMSRLHRARARVAELLSA